MREVTRDQWGECLPGAEVDYCISRKNVRYVQTWYSGDVSLDPWIYGFDSAMSDWLKVEGGLVESLGQVDGTFVGHGRRFGLGFPDELYHSAIASVDGSDVVLSVAKNFKKGESGIYSPKNYPTSPDTIFSVISELPSSISNFARSRNLPNNFRLV